MLLEYNVHPKKLLFGWLPQKRPTLGASFVGGPKFTIQDLKYGSMNCHHAIQRHKIVQDGDHFVTMDLINT